MKGERDSFPWSICEEEFEYTNQGSDVRPLFWNASNARLSGNEGRVEGVKEKVLACSLFYLFLSFIVLPNGLVI